MRAKVARDIRMGAEMAHNGTPATILAALMILYAGLFFIVPTSQVRAQTWEQQQQQMRQQAAQDRARELQIQRMLRQQQLRQQQFQQQQFQQQQYQYQQQQYQYQKQQQLAEQQRQQQLRQQQEMDRQFCFSQCQTSYYNCNTQFGANQSCFTNQSLCMNRC